MSPATAEPITPEVLAWAVEEDGRAPAELAAQIRVGATELLAWTQGMGAPTRGQLTELAHTLRRPRSLFFLPTPPRAASLPTSFRHAPGDDARSVSPTSRRVIRRARHLQSLVSWVLQDSGARKSDLPLIRPETPPSAAAVTVRSWLGVSVAEQRSWRDEYAALRGWRGALEQHELLVFQFEIHGGELRGFSAWNAWAPLIVVNSTAQTPLPRIYTMAHELGHLVTRTDAACLDWIAPSGRERSLERWCEEFAAALLLPADAVEDLLPPDVLGKRRSAELTEVRKLMTGLRVSARASALRLIDLGYAQQQLYAATVATFVPATGSTSSSSGGGTPRPELRLRQYGPGTITTISDAAERGRLTARDAAAALKVDFAEMTDIAELARRRSGG